MPCRGAHGPFQAQKEFAPTRCRPLTQRGSTPNGYARRGLTCWPRWRSRSSISSERAATSEHVPRAGRPTALLYIMLIIGVSGEWRSALLVTDCELVPFGGRTGLGAGLRTSGGWRRTGIPGPVTSAWRPCCSICLLSRGRLARRRVRLATRSGSGQPCSTCCGVVAPRTDARLRCDGTL
jgi:hypothetical protein